MVNTQMRDPRIGTSEGGYIGMHRGQGKDRDGACRCNLTAATAPANTALVEEWGCSAYTTAWQRVRRAEAALMPENPVPVPYAGGTW